MREERLCGCGARHDVHTDDPGESVGTGTRLCDTCMVKGHDMCANDPDCWCCRDTMKRQDDMTLVRVGSHRARDRMRRVFPDCGIGRYSWSRAGDFYYVPAHLLGAVLAIKCITRAKDRGDTQPRIRW